MGTDCLRKQKTSLFRDRNNIRSCTNPRSTTVYETAVEESNFTHSPEEEELVTGIESKPPIQESLQGRLAPSVSTRRRNQFGIEGAMMHTRLNVNCH